MTTPRAEEYFRGKRVLPTELRTREFARLPLWVKEQSFFMAGVMDAELAGAFQRASQAVLDGTMGEAEATRIIRAFGYFSHLANIAEDQHHIRRTRAHALAEADAPAQLPRIYGEIAKLRDT